MIITAGAINRSIYFYIVGDAGHSAPGEPITGLLYSDIEAGGSASYARQGAARDDLTLITLASAGTAHADGGFIEVDATNMPGVYRCDYPDAAWVTGVDQTICSIVVAAANNAVAAPIYIDIADIDLRDSVRGGMTALPNADADAAGGLPISDAGGLNFDALNTAAVRLTAARAQVLDDWINAGRLDVILDAIAGDVVNIDGAAMRGTNGANTVTPDVAGTVNALLGANGSNLTNLGGISTGMATEVQAAANSALVANHLDHLLAVDYNPAAKPGASTALFNELIEDDAGVSRYTINALENAPSGSGSSPAAIADAVWDELRAAHVIVGSFGEGINAERLNNQAKADVNAEADTANADYGANTIAPPSISAIAADITAILLDTGTDGVKLSAEQMDKIADHILRRSWATAAASADGDVKSFRSLLGATAKLVNRVAAVGTTLSIYEADDSTAIGAQTLTTDATAEPITGADTV